MSKKRILLIVETSRSYGRRLIEGISRFVLEQGDWQIHLDDRGLMEEPSDWLRQWKGDGVISRTTLPSLAKILKRKKCPVVELHGFGMYGDGCRLYSEVQICDRSIGEMAANHFLERGFRHIGFYSGGRVWWSRTRSGPFIDLLKNRGIECHVYMDNPAAPPTQHPRWENRDERKLKQWLRKLPKPIGIWAITDNQAVRVVEACQDLGYHIPEEVAILGTSNDETLCNLIVPALSSIDVNAVMIGYEAARRLALKMDGLEPESPVVNIPPLQVVTRQSTDIIAIPDQDVVDSIRLIRERACAGLTVEELVQAVDLSRRTLERHFFKYLDRSPHDEIIRIRIEHAKKLLRTSNLSVSSIARHSGFANREYFIRAFGRETGVTPGAFRQGAFNPTVYVDEEESQ